jgi:hypothetical protein
VNGPNFKLHHSNPLPSAAFSSNPRFRTWADINGDGWEDLFVFDWGSGSNGVKTFMQTAGQNALVEATGAGVNPLHGVVGLPAFADLGSRSSFRNHSIDE